MVVSRDSSSESTNTGPFLPISLGTPSFCLLLVRGGGTGWSSLEVLSGELSGRAGDELLLTTGEAGSEFTGDGHGEG